MSDDTVSAERHIDAPPTAIFALLSDAARHQEIDGSGMLRGTRKESHPLTMGSVFGMSMKAGIGYTTKNTVIEYAQDSLIAWQTVGLGGVVGGRIWRYELTPVDDGTLVRETWDVTKDKQRFLLKRSAFPKKNKQAMTRTLDRIAGIVERRDAA